MVEQRQQGPTLYIASLSAVLPHILRQQGNKPVRDLLRKEAADVRIFGHDDRVRTFCLKQLETVNAAIIAEYRRQGEEHFRNGRHEDARRAYRTLIAEYAGTDAAKFAASKLFDIADLLASKHRKEGDIRFHWAMRDYSQALAAYQKATAEMGDISPLWSSLSRQEQQKAQGVKAYLGVRIGECLRNLGRESEAVQQLQDVMQTMQQDKLPDLQGTLAEGIYQLALTLGGNLPSQTKTKDQRLLSIPLLQQVVDIYPTSEWADDAQYMIGAMYYAAGENEKAKQAFEELLRKFPNCNSVKSAKRRVEELSSQVNPKDGKG